MKKLFLFVTIFLIVSMVNAEAAFVSGSTGADGALNPTANTELQLPPNGIFNFTTVNIPSGVTVTFKSNAVNTPVYILATGDVTIAGTISVSGGSASFTVPGIGGPGGYSGGSGGASGIRGGDGLGPGSGKGGAAINYINGGGGGFGTPGSTVNPGYSGAGGSAYGNERLLPLIGGSGGGGAGGTAGSSQGCGGGGGGAILVASSTTITVTGSITANGGGGYSYAASGSGGGIKLMANTIAGNGIINAKGGAAGVLGGAGRIRFEFITNNRTAGTDPTYTMGQPGSVFVANAPSLAITSIAGVAVPSNPTGSYAQPDIVLPNTTVNPLAVNLSAANIPVGTTVTVSAIPLNGSSTDVTTTLSGTTAASTASTNVTVSTQFASVIMAKATFTLQTAMFWDGEKLEKAVVSATPGKPAQVLYISESGKEINEEQLVMAGLIIR